MREMAFAVKKRAAQLSLQLLNRTRERGLRNVALFSRAREIQFLRDGKKITDLVHLHTDTPRKPPWASMLSAKEVDCQPVLTGWAKAREHTRIPARCTAIAGLYQLISQ